MSTWSDLALLVAGGALTQGATVVQRRASRKERREDNAAAAAGARQLVIDDQTRAALLVVAENVILLATVANRTDGTALDRQAEEAITALRRQALLVAHADLRSRIRLAAEVLEWRRAIPSTFLGAGIVYLSRYVAGDLEPAIGAFLRGEVVPPRSERMDDCERALQEVYDQPHC